MIPTFSILLAYTYEQEHLKVDVLDFTHQRFTVADKLLSTSVCLSDHALDAFCDYVVGNLFLPRFTENGRYDMFCPTREELPSIFRTIYAGRENLPDGPRTHRSDIFEYSTAKNGTWMAPMEAPHKLLLYGNICKILRSSQSKGIHGMDDEVTEILHSSLAHANQLAEEGLTDLIYDLTKNVTPTAVNQKAVELSQRMNGVIPTRIIATTMRSQLHQMGYSVKKVHKPGTLDSIEEAYILE